jgi:hypothetical protein
MANIKEMPVKEKYANLSAAIKQDSFTPAYIESNLGHQALVEYQEECQKVVKPVPADTAEAEKYELAYGNWISTGGLAFTFIRKQAGEEGLERYIRADVEVIKRANAGPALFFLKLMRLAAPGAAFTLAAKQIAYKLQWLTPYSVPELSSSRVVLEVPHCKVLDYTGGDSSCVVGCQKIYGIWLAEQFQLEMKTRRKGYSCTLSIAPKKQG